MGIEKELLEAKRESIKRLESMSAFEFMEDASLFMKDLEKLVGKQHLPTVVLVGCLMSEIYILNARPDDMLLNAKLEKVFVAFKRYVDEKFMEKE